MGWIINLIAVLVSVAGLLVVLGNDAYLGLLQNVARKRAGSEVTQSYVRSKLPVAAGTTAAALVAVLLTSGGAFSDILAIVIGAGAGSAALMQLGGVRRKYGSPTV